jgi:hypothetical protein
VPALVPKLMRWPRIRQIKLTYTVLAL